MAIAGFLGGQDTTLVLPINNIMSMIILHILSAHDMVVLPPTFLDFLAL
jgi:hypothetical protein